jgi:hypothetical protein
MSEIFLGRFWVNTSNFWSSNAATAITLLQIPTKRKTKDKAGEP